MERLRTDCDVCRCKLLCHMKDKIERTQLEDGDYHWTIKSGRVCLKDEDPEFSQME